MHILIKSTLQLMISNLWLSLRRWLAYYLYLLAIYVMPDGKRRFISYYELIRFKQSKNERCETRYMVNKQEYEWLKSNDDFNERLRTILGSSLINGLFDNNFVHVSQKEELDGNITFSAEVYALPSGIAYSIFDEPKIVGWIPRTKHKKNNDKQDNASVLTPNVRDIIKQLLREQSGLFK